MTSTVYVVTDLGPGDGGKGGVVHKLSHMSGAHTIIKRGGAQGSHGVRTSSGNKFNFSQWGCGTFEGVRTHLSQQMIISPEGLLNEANALKYEYGIWQPFSLLTVDEEALCATEFHGIASRLKELARGDNPRGTVGTGVGEAYRDFVRSPELAIRARDLTRPDLRARLAAMRDDIRLRLQPIIEGEFLPEDQAEAAEEIYFLGSDEFFEYVVSRFEEAGKAVRVVGREYLRDEILSQDGVAVVETSHGVLTDRVAGFHPHTSAIRTLPRFTRQLFDEAGYGGELVNIGVTRAYAIRHGAGPIPTADPSMSDHLLPGSNKGDNRYQGKVRVGALDFVLLRYALEVCGGPSAFDGLAISWFDQIQRNGSWNVCTRYGGADDPAYFSPSGEIRLPSDFSFEHQQTLGQRLLDCRPEVTTLPIDSDAGNDASYRVCADVFEKQLGVPVRMVSFGPTELDKLCK